MDDVYLVGPFLPARECAARALFDSLLPKQKGWRIDAVTYIPGECFSFSMLGPQLRVMSDKIADAGFTPLAHKGCDDYDARSPLSGHGEHYRRARAPAPDALKYMLKKYSTPALPLIGESTV